jgi:hypothetical protein
MPSPHDHTELLKNLTKEVKAMPTLKRERTAPPAPVIVEEPIEAEEIIDEEFDLERELDRMQSALKESAVVQEETAPVSREEFIRLQILDTLYKREDAPSAEQIDAWKQKHGSEGVQVLALDSQNVYIFTHLTWGQWERVSKLSESIQKQGNADAEKAMREAVVRAAVLWPKLPADFFQNCRAGLPTTLMDQIMIVSYFLNPEQAMSLTTRL